MTQVEFFCDLLRFNLDLVESIEMPESLHVSFLSYFAFGRRGIGRCFLAEESWNSFINERLVIWDALAIRLVVFPEFRVYFWGAVLQTHQALFHLSSEWVHGPNFKLIEAFKRSFLLLLR